MTVSRHAQIRGVVWGSVILLSAGVAVYAFNPQPEPPAHYYGLMTVAAGQHVSLHVANTKMAVDTFRPSDTCMGRMQIVDACGQRLVGHMIRIQPGASRSLNFTIPTDQLPPGPCMPTEITADPPTEFRGIITGDPQSETEPPDPDRWALRAEVVFNGQAGHCVSSLEVGDPFIGGATGGGGSGFIHPGLIVGFNPQPDPPGAPTRAPR